MKTTLHLFLPVMLVSALLVSCANNESSTTHNENETVSQTKPTNTTLANNALNGRIKTMSTFTKTVNEETGKPAQKIKTEHYNEDGNITLKETFILTDGNKKPISTETYTYNNGLLESIEEKDANNSIVTSAIVVHAEGKRVQTYKNGKGQLILKFMYSFNPSYSYDSAKIILFNSLQEPEVTLYNKHEYSDDGQLKRVITIPEIDGAKAGVEFYGFATNNALEKDEAGNMTKYTLKKDVPNGESSIDTITCTYEYY